MKIYNDMSMLYTLVYSVEMQCITSVIQGDIGPAGGRGEKGTLVSTYILKV